MRIRYKIQHLMWLTFWTALVLGFRETLATAPAQLAGAMALVADAIIWASGLGALGLVAGLYGVAYCMDEGHEKDHAVTNLCNVLLGDLVAFFVFLMAGEGR